ncbi:asparaginase [Microbispora sp. KK1-11]|uniref:asparaginase n=1 Tax=Microbispora sp. KK1-11 TaxID=2053005 RepID=UPI00115BC798|nr:asparaginase [Microbispora sp. KK1-11]TQS26851.1 asparaginase [Microbispora sp. KK1-11]
MSARIRVITTGGTIASVPGPGGEVSVAVAGRDLIGAAGAAVTVEVDEAMLVHSFNLTLDDMLRIVERVAVAVADPEVDGVVVTHGTDTMEETAFFVDLLLDARRTVVFTGAQRHAGEPDGDGPRNLADALQVAAATAGRGLGAVVVMAGRVHAARYATKAHTVAPDAVDSPGYGPIGRVHDGRVHIAARPERLPGFTLAELEGLAVRVDIVPAYLGADGVHVAASRAAGALGLVLEALGAGNPTPGLLGEIRACVAAGIPVLVTSRCHAGPSVPVYGAGGGATLQEAGAVFAGSLAAPKARLLLTAALAAEPGPSEALARLGPHLTI